MNNDKINSNISNYIFKKNKYSLTKKCTKIKDKNLNFCKNFSIKNKKAGFNYKGNNNLCYLYKNHKPTKKLNNTLINNYTKRKFVKNEIQKNANIYQQNDPFFYFKELNDFNLHSTNLIKKNNAEKIEDCMTYCLDNPECNSITYFQEPQECIFYDKVNLANNKNHSYDSYTLDKDFQNVNKDIQNENKEKDKKEREDKPFNYNDNIYTKCFTNENYKDYKNTIKNYNQICKRELGNEYIFSNIYDNTNIKQCENNKIKILCKPSFLEHFTNNSNYGNKIYPKFLIFILLITILLLIFFIINYFKNYSSKSITKK